MHYQHHPDMQINTSATGTYFNQLKNAYDVLLNEQSRTDYDIRLLANSNVSIWTEVDVDELELDGDEYTYSCRCGGQYRMIKIEVKQKEDVLVQCDTCSLYIKVLADR